jgi:hypothetical protein
MRKFNTVLKEKQTKEEQLVEKKVLGQFTRVYNALLEKYGIPEFKQLSEKAQNVFLSELNSYWSEAEGVSEMGVKFLNTRGRALNEHSSSEQKKNFLQEKANIVIGEIIRQSELKYKLYDILDEIYTQTKAEKLSDIMPSSSAVSIIKEGFQKNIRELLLEINYELAENSKPENV